MYFNEKKENTNIDSEFKNSKKINFDLKKINLKTILFITGGIILLLIIIFVIISLTRNSNKHTLELYGEESIVIGLNREYNEPGYKAYDNKNNDVTNQVEVSNSVDTTKVGNYEILYSIGKITKVRYITVKELADETYIYLNGKVNGMYLEVGEKYKEPGYIVFDSIDEGLENKVKITGSVDTTKEGIYRLTYTVVNSRNITVTATRTVIVVGKGQKPKN